MKKFVTMIVAGALSLALVACGGGDSKKVVLTAGFAKDELFRIEESVCTVPEIMVYLTNIQNQYESVYGKEIWNTKIDGVTLEENVKEMALSKMAQVKAINLLAIDRGVELNEEENAIIENAAAEYYSSLNNAEIEAMGITKDTIVGLYREYAISEKLYQDIIKDINPEISDDEARTITVEHILIKTYDLDSNGNKVEFTEHAKSVAYTRAMEVLDRARAGEDFESLATEYSDDDTITYSFGKGEMDPVFENASFDLGNDEISDIIETEYGFHIVKCISTFNREVTDANKIKIVDERRDEAFGEEYDAYVSTLTKNFNDELWGQISFITDSEVTTSTFFEVFDKYWDE